jgi:hypothetical protein
MYHGIFSIPIQKQYNTIPHLWYKIRTRSRDKLMIKICFVILRLTKYINNTRFIGLVEMSLKMTLYMQASSPGELCVYFLKPGLLCLWVLFSYVCIMYQMGGPIFIL